MRNERENKNIQAVTYTVFLVTCSTLIFEISVTRLFSISLWYHFTFMVISLAMLGIGTAGTVLSVFSTGSAVLLSGTSVISSQPRIYLQLFRSGSLISVYPLLAGFSICSALFISSIVPFDPARLSWDRAQIFYLVLYCLSLSLPFFFSGLLTATAFSLYSERSGLIYGADLTGAGTGSVFVLVMLNSVPPEYAVVSASMLCAAGSFLSGGKLLKITSLSFSVIILFMLLFYADLFRIKMSPFKTLSTYLEFPGAEHLKTFYSPYSQIDSFRSPAVRFAPGMSLLYSGPLPDQIGLSRDGDRIDVVTDARDKNGLRFLEYLPSSAAYEIGKKKDHVLVLDPGGGLAALTSEYYGSESIYKVESNPLVVEVVRSDFHAFSGHVFENNTLTGYGRSFLSSRDGALFDLIDLSLTGATVSGVFGISEDYRFTVEAFRQYLKSLKNDGMMSISLYLTPPPRTEFRILATLAAAAEHAGTGNIMTRLAALRSWDSVTILVKNSPYSVQEIGQLKDFSQSRRFDLLYYPGIKEEESSTFIKTPSDEYFRGFQEILDPATRHEFMSNYLFNVRPVHDDSPFFHNYLRLSTLKATYETMGRNWLYFLEEGFLLPVIFLMITLSAAAVILIPIIFGKHFKVSLRNIISARKKSSSVVPVLVYFSMLGLGFMLVEVTFIQKSMLLLENPAYAIAAVITGILAGAGLGSIATARFSGSITPFWVLFLSVIIIIYSFMYEMLPPMLYPLHPLPRTAVVFMIMLPAGFIMGMPFPAGIRLLGAKHPVLIPWAWAINASVSVVAPVLTIMIALTAGFSTVLWIGAISYSIASVSLMKMTKWTKGPLPG